MTDVTFVRINGIAARTILAVRTSELEEVETHLASLFGPVLDRVSREALPGVAELMAADLDTYSREAMPVGTTEGDDWTSWSLPAPAPAVAPMTRQTTITAGPARTGPGHLGSIEGRPQ
ncbi:hypothetical protein [Actinomadura sp. HBU206391]|uniref:hypothetical protein n=1 Tax=Actinomadura sp. HBU206391 TaxID=2731692 RepID=UPI00165043B7|nr:hypothetical protein [Actinomadura sp. HBU206391]MBC6458401.1 hypothetical protein [Actinomadura sp. HBU206391]